MSEQERQPVYERLRNYTGIITQFLSNCYPKTSEYIFSQYINRNNHFKLKPLMLRPLVVTWGLYDSTVLQGIRYYESKEKKMSTACTLKSRIVQLLIL